MPGYILHLTAGAMYLNGLPEEDLLQRSEKARNDFFVGNLMPDAVSDKSQSHFRDPKYGDRMMIWPHLDMFREKYGAIMDEPACRGYYFHLYIDKKFFEEYIPRVAEFYDRNNRITEIRDEIAYVRLKKTGEELSPERYLSEEYYYGDYTKMNTWLCRHYHLPENLVEAENPGIEEVDFRNIGKVLEELEGYRNVPAKAVDDLKVFDLTDLLKFLEEAAAEAAEKRIPL